MGFRAARGAKNPAAEKRKGHPATGRPFPGRIVPTEAKPSELSGEILCLPPEGVKAKSVRQQLYYFL